MSRTPAVEPMNGLRTPDNNLDLMLKESITHFLADYERGCSDFSLFASIFSRLIQSMTDPPLEITWFYSAMTFHSYPCKKSVMAAKDLFQLLISCSTPCNNGLKRVALLAPVVYLLYYIALDWVNMVSCLKREIEGLVEGFVSFISIYCSRNMVDWPNGSDKLNVGFVDLLGVWTLEKFEVGDDLQVFFPLVSGEVCDAVKVGGVDYLAGVVMVEVFFLRLCLKFDSNVSREELKEDMQVLAVQTIQGFQNRCFFDILLTMLLEPSLPINALVNPNAEVLLREVLYDAVILVEYSFLSSLMWDQLPSEKFVDFAVRWLLISDNAVQFARYCGDQTKAISFVDAFSNSRLPSQLIKWVTDQAGPGEEISWPNVSTPKALIRWLLALENQGLRVIVNYISKLQYKAAINWKYPDGSIFICFEGNGRGQNKVEDQEMMDRLDDTSIASDCMGQQMEAERRRKRKEGYTDEGETRFKLTKFNRNGDLGREMSFPHSNDNLNIQSMV